MSHEIETAAIHGSAWHNAGIRVDHLMTVEEALEAGGLNDWGLKKVPMVHVFDKKALTPDEWIKVLSVAVNTGTGHVERDNDSLQPTHVYLPSEETFGHYRMKDITHLGDVGKSYQSIANEYLGQVFKLLCDKDGLAVAKIQSVGSLRGGKQVWVLLSLPDSGFTVGNRKDQIIPYLLGTNAHDGTAAGRFLPTTVNVVCWNTLNAALGEAYAALAVSVRHTGDIEAKMKEVQDMMAQAAMMFGDFKRIGDELDDRKVTQEAFGEVMNFLFPPIDETKASNKMIANRNAKILLLTEAVKQEVALLPQYTLTGGGNQEFSYWTLLNGITRFTTHMQGVRVGKDEQENEKRFESQVLGAGAEFNAKATRKILELAEVK